MEDVARIYRTANSIDRSRIQVEIVRACRPYLAWLARGLAPECAPDAEKVGALGALIALEKYDPARGAFWPFARSYVCDEIERWLSRPSGPDGDDGEPIPEDDAVWLREGGMTATAAVVPTAPASETRFRTVAVVTDVQAMALDDLAVRIARRFARSSAEAEDLAQEGRLGLLDAARLWREDGGASFRTFAYGRVLGRVLHAVKRERRRGLRGPKGLPVPPAASFDEEDVDGRTPHDRIGVPATQEDACVRAATLSAAVDALPERLRRVVVLLLEGLSYDEIAGSLGIVSGAVRTAASMACESLGSKSLERRMGRHRRDGSDMNAARCWRSKVVLA